MDIRLGYTLPSEANLNPGFSIGIEPRYWLGNHFSIGVKADIHNFSSDFADTSPNRSQSYFILGDIYSTSAKKDRLYSGVGIGIFRDGGFSGVFGSGGARTSEAIQGRVGYMIGMVRLGFEYNVVLQDDAFDHYGFYFSWSPF